MKRTILTALVGALLASGSVHAACTLGGHPSGPQPPLSLATLQAPTIGGSAPWNTIWVTHYGQLPDEPFREISNLRDRIPQSLNGPSNVPVPPNPPAGSGGGNRCDSLRTVAGTGQTSFNSMAGVTSYLERLPISLGLYRHLIELDLSSVKSFLDLRTKTYSRWPIAAWKIPMHDSVASDVVGLQPLSQANLRVDFTGPTPSSDSHLVKSAFVVYWNDHLIATVPVGTATPTVELKWSADGQMLLLFDTADAADEVITQLPLASTVIQGFQPSSFQVGWVDMPNQFVASYGMLYAYSHLIEAPAQSPLVDGER